MRVVIRDDDTCGFTQPEDVQSCYEQVWSFIPISLSVTPFRIPGDHVTLPNELFGSDVVLPLHENRALVQMLREQVNAGHVDIAMHGYHHLRYCGLPEYVAGEELTKKTIEGRAYLEELLKTNILTFIPPNNGIGISGLAAVVSAGMNLVNVPSLWSNKCRSVSRRTLCLAPRYYWHKILRKRRYPHILDIGDHKEVEYHTVGPRSQRKALIAELDYCDEHDGIFVLSTHYHAFDRCTMDNQTVRSLLFDLINRASGKAGVEFVGINSIW